MASARKNATREEIFVDQIDKTIQSIKEILKEGFKQIQAFDEAYKKPKSSWRSLGRAEALNKRNEVGHSELRDCVSSVRKKLADVGTAWNNLKRLYNDGGVDSVIAELGFKSLLEFLNSYLSVWRAIYDMIDDPGPPPSEGRESCKKFNKLREFVSSIKGFDESHIAALKRTYTKILVNKDVFKKEKYNDSLPKFVAALKDIIQSFNPYPYPPTELLSYDVPAASASASKRGGARRRRRTLRKRKATRCSRRGHSRKA